LKCDRGNPCATYARRGLSLSCSYGNSNTPIPTTDNHALGNKILQEHIKQLEKLIVSLASAPQATKPALHPLLHPVPDNIAVDSSLVPNSESLSESLDRTDIDADKIEYTDSTN
jgi:hypothetical protein